MKAMVTPTNQSWTLAALLGELVQERVPLPPVPVDEHAQKAQ